MTQQIHFVITDCGDGSNGVQWVLDDSVLDKMEELAGEGDGQYASGDGLQVKTLRFPDGFDLPAWVAENHLLVTTLDDMCESLD